MGPMSVWEDALEQMAQDITLQAYALEPLRLQGFLCWLMDHNSQIKAAISGEASPPSRPRFKSILQSWLDSLPVQGAIWELRLIQAEMDWWRELDPARLNLLREAGDLR